MNQRKAKQTTTQTIQMLRDIASGFQRSRVLLTAFELGVFSAIRGEYKSSNRIAALLKTNPRATDRLLNALCALGFLKKRQYRFSCTPLSLKFFVKGEPTYLPGLMHAVHLWDTWSTLTEAVIKGTSVSHRAGTNDRGSAWLSAFIAAMHDRAKISAGPIVRTMNLSGVERVLDVGGGSGAYAMAFVRAGRGITATIFDLPNVIPLSRRYVASAGLSDRINFLTGDYLNDRLGKGYDLVFLSAIIHSNSSGENRRLIKKCARALNPGGRVVVQDFIMDDDRVHPPHGALFALNMLVGTARGDTYTAREVSAWMKSAGLANIERNDNRFGTTQIAGRRSR
jgi:SAM-dependent methyltransferase